MGLWDMFCGAVNAVWDGVTNIFSGGEKTSKKIAKEAAYDRDTASIEQTLRITNNLDEFKNMAADNSQNIEYELGDSIENVFEKLLEHIDTMSQKINLKLPVALIRASKRATLRQIRGIIKQGIFSKLSLDNQACLAILKIDDTKQKESQMRDFINQSIKDSVAKLKKQINESVEESIEIIKERLDEHLNRYKDMQKRDLKSLERFKNSEGKDNDAKEAAQLEVAQAIFESHFALNLIKKDKK